MFTPCTLVFLPYETVVSTSSFFFLVSPSASSFPTSIFCQMVNVVFRNKAVNVLKRLNLNDGGHSFIHYQSLTSLDRFSFLLPRCYRDYPQWSTVMLTAVIQQGKRCLNMVTASCQLPSSLMDNEPVHCLVNSAVVAVCSRYCSPGLLMHTSALPHLGLMERCGEASEKQRLKNVKAYIFF